MRKEVFWKNPRYVAGETFEGKASCKYLVVGAGIAGLSSVYFLLEGGVLPGDIVVVEEEMVGSGSTGRSAGMIVPEAENEENVWWDTIIVRYGLSLAKEYRNAQIKVLDFFEEIIKKGNISCEASRRDFIVLGRDEQAKKRIKGNVAALRLFGESPEELSGSDLQGEFKSSRFVYGIRIMKALSVNPLAFIQGFGEFLRREGVRIYEHTRFLEAVGGVAKFSKGEIFFDSIIYAMGMGENGAPLHKYVTSIAITEPLSGETLKGIGLLDKDMFIDEEGEKSFHYGKVTEDNRLLLGYGDQETKNNVSKSELDGKTVSSIEQFLKHAFPTTSLTIEYAWSGGYAISQKLVPYVSVEGGHVIVNGAGIQAASVVAANYAVSRLLGRNHKLEGIFESS